jgi:hypothetical protein
MTFKLVVSSTLTFVSCIYSVLYTHCVAKLQEFMEFDIGSAGTSLECFHELFGLVCSHHKDKLGHFLGEVGMSF